MHGGLLDLSGKRQLATWYLVLQLPDFRNTLMDGPDSAALQFWTSSGSIMRWWIYCQQDDKDNNRNWNNAGLGKKFYYAKPIAIAIATPKADSSWSSESAHHFLR